MKKTVIYKFKNIIRRAKKRIIVTEDTILDKDARIAFNNLYIARSNFNESNDLSIDLAIYELLVAEERLNVLIKERKQENIKKSIPAEC